MNALPVTGLQPASTVQVFLSPLTQNWNSLSSLQHPPDQGETQIIKLDTLETSLMPNCHISPMAGTPRSVPHVPESREDLGTPPLPRLQTQEERRKSSTRS